MKWQPSAFYNDVVTLSLWDLVRLLFGRTLKDSACEVKVSYRR